MVCRFFFFNDTATTEIYTLSLHDALPICSNEIHNYLSYSFFNTAFCGNRSEEHTSELQSLRHLVCRLLLEKNKKNHHYQWMQPRRPLRATSAMAPHTR